MTKLEELARAYADAWKADIEAHIPDHGKIPSWDEMGPNQRAAMMRVTRAVIEKALREPNEKMGVAMLSARTYFEADRNPRLTEDRAAAIGIRDKLAGNPAKWCMPEWRSAIDAILADK